MKIFLPPTINVIYKYKSSRQTDTQYPDPDSRQNTPSLRPAPPRPAPPGWYLDNLYNLRHVQTFLWLGVCYNLYIYLGVVCCVVKQSCKIILYLASKGNLRSLQTSSRGPVTIILQNYCSSWKLGSGCATFCASSAHPR